MKNLILLIGFLLFMFNCSKDVEAPEIYEVKYEIIGTAQRVNVIYENSLGGVWEIEDISIPWSINVFRVDGSFLYICAQNQYQGGSVTVFIYIDNILFKRSTSNDPYAIVSASGIVN